MKMGATSKSGATSWGYLIVLSKFTILFIDSGIEKSFGVLIPTMVERLDSDYATIGLICSMPPTIMYLLCPLVTLALKKINHRAVAISGGLMSGLCVIACAFFKTTVTVGVSLALAGIGLAMTYMPTILALNDFFGEKLLFWTTVCSFGYTTGSMLLPVVIEKSFQAYGYQGAFVILGGVTLNLVVCGATIRKPTTHGDTSEGNSRGSVEKNPEFDFQKRISVNQEHFFIKMEAEERGEEALKPDGMEMNEENQENANCEETLSEERRLLPQESPCERRPETLKNESALCSSGLLQERVFLFSIPVPFLMCFSIYAWMLFLVPHAQEVGIPLSKAVFLSTIGGIAGVVGRIIFIFLIRIGISDLVIYLIAGSICSASLLLDFIGYSFAVRATLAFVQGFALFIEETICTSLSKRAVFDEKNFEMAMALTHFACGLGITCAGVFTGYLFDVTQSFTKVFIIIGFIHAIAVINLLVVVVLIKRHACKHVTL